MNPVARLFGSLANALLDLGLPTIRQWLRDRIGPAADVAQVTTEGSLVHLDGVTIPVGPRGLLVLSRATAAITALGRAGLPEARLHAFSGVLGFGDDAHWFRAEVSFVSSPEPDESAWISGDLSIRNATWAAREGSPKTNPMDGHARLFVSSSEWRIDGGRLDGEIFRGRFAGTGRFDAVLPNEEEERPLVPAALSSGALSLEHARVGPFLDAASGLGGKGIAIPAFIPLDAELDGELSWSLTAGGRAELRVASEAIRATLRGGVGSTGRDLGGRIDAHVRPAMVLRGGRVPREAMPRDEDTLSIALDIAGELRRPEVKGTVHGAELGFRLGGPRFVPAVLVHEPRCELFLKDDRIVVQAVALARSTKVTLDLDANVRDPSSARGTLRAEALEAAFLRDVVRTLGAKLTVPDDVRGAVDFTLAPSDVAPGRPRIAGGVTLSTALSKLSFEVAPDGAMRIVGGVAAADVLATGVVDGAVVPVEGDLVVALDVATGPVLRGTAGSSRLVLALPRRPEVPPYVLEGATVDVALDRKALTYEALRFRAHGGRFVARGAIPIEPDPAAVLVDLELEEGGAALAEALAQLANAPPQGAAGEGTERRPVRFCVARDGQRPADEIWIPRELVGRGRLRLGGDLALDTDVRLETPNGTALDVRVVLARGGRLDGSTCAGLVSVVDVASSGGLGPLAAAASDPTELVDVDVLVASGADAPRALIAFRSERLTLALAKTALAVADVAGDLRVDATGAAWNRVYAKLQGGTITSSGVARANDLQARISFSQVPLHELPPMSAETTGEVAIGTFVRGRLSGTVIGRVKDRSLHAAGDVMIEDATFPALDLVRPALARYGLRPPSEDAAAPATATIVGTDWGISVRDVKIDLHGASLRGELGLSRERMLDGHAEVTLEEEYLRTSKLLTLPRVLTERLVLPVRIEGPLDRPHIRAGIAESLGRFLKDNRVSAFVTSAVEEAQYLLGRHPIREPEPSHERVPHEQALDASLRRALDAHAEDWETIAQRRARRRIG